MKVSRSILELGSLYMAVKDVNMTFNFLWVGEKSIISSNGKGVVRVKHYGVIAKPFHIHRDVVLLALKQTRAKSFELSEHKIVCYDKDNAKTMCFSRDSKSIGFLAPFPSVDSAFPKEVAKSIRFMDSSHVNGIFAVNGVLIDSRLLPKKFPEDFRGFIGINDASKPVTISDKRKDVEIAILPIINNFFKFTEEE